MECYNKIYYMDLVYHDSTSIFGKINNDIDNAIFDIYYKYIITVLPKQQQYYDKMFIELCHDSIDILYEYIEESEIYKIDYNIIQEFKNFMKLKAGFIVYKYNK